MDATPDSPPTHALGYRSAPAKGALGREDSSAYYVGRWFRRAALVLCVPLLLWGLTRPIIVAYLGGQTRFALLLLVGLPTLGFCALFWFVGVILLGVSYRHDDRRDVVEALLPVGLGLFTIALPTVFPVVYSPVRAAAKSVAADGAAWDAAAARVRQDLNVGKWASTSEDSSMSVGGVAVEAVGLDANGGVWLRTRHAADMIDRISYGLYHQPAGASLVRNPNGNYPSSPFGAKNLKITPLGNGWNTFEANDDFH